MNNVQTSKCLKYLCLSISIVLFSQITLNAGVIIEYSISTIKENNLVDRELILPSNMTLAFNDEYAKVQELKSSGFINQFKLYPSNENFFYSCTSFMGQSKAYKREKPSYKISHHADTLSYTILGYPCKKAIAVHEKDTIEILYTDYFGKGFFPYGDLNGVALLYTKSDQYFEKLIYEATFLTFGEIPQSTFDISKFTIEKPKPESKSSKMMGRRFEFIKAKNLQGEKIDINLKNRVTILNFWFVSCSPCVREMPYLNKLREMFRGSNDVRFVAIAKDNYKQVLKFLDRRNFEFEHLTQGLNLATKFGVTSYPTNIVIDKNGLIVAYHEGYTPVTVHELSQSIIELLNKP